MNETDFYNVGVHPEKIYRIREFPVYIEVTIDLIDRHLEAHNICSFSYDNIDSKILKKINTNKVPSKGIVINETKDEIYRFGFIPMTITLNNGRSLIKILLK